MTLDLNVHRPAGKIISSLPGWLLITMMIMVILRAICPAAADGQCGAVTTVGFRAASPRSAAISWFGDVEHGVFPAGYRQTMISWTGPVLMIGWVVPNAAPLHDLPGLYMGWSSLASYFLAALFSRSDCYRLRGGRR